MTVQVDAARAAGRLAGRKAIPTGIWPRCPFDRATQADLAAAWGSGALEVLGPIMAPKPKPAS